MTNLAPKSLQDLTNEFLKNFFELAHAEKVKEKKESTMPQLVSAKRDDSFEFNYALAECIANSEHVKNSRDNDYPLIGSGFASNIAKRFFENNIKGINKKVLYVIKNIKNQDKFLDYHINDLDTKSKDITTNDINANYFRDKSQPLMVPVNKKETTHTFHIHNNKSGYEGICTVVLINNELDKTTIQGYSSTSDVQVIINSREEAELHHFKHIADINSFFIVLDQIVYGIKETLKEKKQIKSK